MVPRERKKDVGCHLAQVLFAMKGSIHTAAKHISHNAHSLQENNLKLASCHGFLRAPGTILCLPTAGMSGKFLQFLPVGSGSDSRPGGEQEILLSKAVCKNLGSLDTISLTWQIW